MPVETLRAPSHHVQDTDGVVLAFGASCGRRFWKLGPGDRFIVDVDEGCFGRAVSYGVG
jgi:hypothetical protein